MHRYHAGLFFIILLQTICGHAYPIKANLAKHAMVVTEQQIASQVGVDILRAGGNAIDAAVAVGYALAVVSPCCGNLGGGGFMTIRFANGKTTFLNFREKAPLHASKDMFLDEHGDITPKRTTQGYLAVAVPGTVLGLDTALTKYGRLSRHQVMLPAIKLAQHGFRVSTFDASAFKAYAPLFREQPNIANIFLKHDQPYRAGEKLIQKDLANSLQLIAQKGPDAFYRGSIAKNIVKSSQANSGLLTLDDFTLYKVEELTPLTCNYRSYKIISAPPPSSGGVTLCEMLSILENLPLRSIAYNSVTSTHYIIEAMRYAFTDRNSTLGDPDFVANPIAHLLAPTYTAEISRKIRAETSVPHSQLPNKLREQTDTTHYSVLDRQGNAVAVTFTLNGFFGANVIADHTGFFLNDEMDDFTTKPGTANNFELVQSDANMIQPGKRPLSSMTPTIVEMQHQPFLILGSPGGPRIITAVLLALLNVIDYDMNLQQAIDAPRYHFQVLPDFVNLEPHALPLQTLSGLEKLGYYFRQQKTWSAIEAIKVDPGKQHIEGANDYRRPNGAALGY